jgi:protoheme IX farnesyltransferase
MKSKVPEIIQWQTYIYHRSGYFLALTKPRLLLLVLITTAAGYYLALTQTFDFLMLVYVLFGTALVGGAANTLNQWYEAIPDANMERTQNRPIPSGKLTQEQAAIFGIVLSIAGFIFLALNVNWTATFLAFLTWGIYLFIYTPMKQKTYLNTWIGAITGALPPLIGWVAGGGQLSIEAWSLFAILFFWQLPHFFAISWLYREDYQNGGFQMLSKGDETGDRTAFHIMFNTIVLIAVSLVPFSTGQFAWIYLSSALVLGAVFFKFSFAFVQQKNIVNVRQTFFCSIIYLPILLLMMILDKTFL